MDEHPSNRPPRRNGRTRSGSPGAAPPPGRRGRKGSRGGRRDGGGRRDDARSRSPMRDGRERENFRNRSPPRGPRRGASPPPTRMTSSHPRSKPSLPSRPALAITEKLDLDTEEGIEEIQQKMLKFMGFALFRTTKQTKVPGNDKLYAVRKDKQMKARQYMNRNKGFNRPLSPSR
ncbi:hypothetical protein K432DRAFT_357364 [Lepidopterella palustris CBS 459.81]|uniref:U4/U6.U5 small nuclear ribonucleoprotein 27kDa protein domain-containing protein n=1 Tax=Lepidopterella palustris CBS 459.81 TaxID=1314670 RepID=A0A8E2JD65_9PEZI|nr:hypothetical protein K432DRAFT_357364 [Lepidopterella palustris CBS 459.81]